MWRIATVLSRAGVEPGHVVCATFVDDLLHMACVHAIARIGASLHGLRSGDSPLARRRAAQAVRGAVLITDREDSDSAGLPVVLLDLAALSAAGAPVDERVRVESPEAPWLIITGSGTTGRSKRIPLHHQVSARRIRTRAAGMPMRPGERVMSLSAMDFSVTKQRSIEALALGAPTVLITPGRGDELDQIRSADVLHVTPLHARRLLAAIPDGEAPALRPGSRIVIASSTAPESLRATVRARLTPNLWIPYSANELGLMCVADPAAVARTPGTVGRPLPEVTLQIVDDDGRALPPGRVGLIRVRSPGLIPGYLDDPEATAAAFRDGWFHPGDMGAFTADGELIFRGRADDMMVFDGINIFPVEIEGALLEHPEVADAAAVTLASPEHGDVPFAAVILRDGATATPEQLRAWGRERLGMRAAQAVFVVDAFPRTPNGKILRRPLAERVREMLQVGA